MTPDKGRTLDELERTIEEIARTSMSTQRRKELLEHITALRFLRAGARIAERRLVEMSALARRCCVTPHGCALCGRLFDGPPEQHAPGCLLEPTP